MKKLKSPININLVFILIYLTIQSAFSQHQHGVGELSMVIENKAIEIEIRLPGADVLGFEHAPETKNDSAKLSKVTNFFEKPKEWLSLPNKAKCKLAKLSVTFGSENNLHEEHHHNHDDHDHDSHHSEHEGKNKKDNEESHREMIGSFRYECSKPKALTKVQLTIFEHFPSIVKMNYIAVGNKQSQGSLTKEKNEIKDF